MPRTPNMPLRVSSTSAVGSATATSAWLGLGLLLARPRRRAEETSGAGPVSFSGLVPASGSDSPCGSAPLTGAFASDSS